MNGNRSLPTDTYFFNLKCEQKFQNNSFLIKIVHVIPPCGGHECVMDPIFGVCGTLAPWHYYPFTAHSQCHPIVISAKILIFVCVSNHFLISE